jgi:hypothetical protein
MELLTFGAVVLFCLVAFGGLFRPPLERQVIIVRGDDPDYNRGGCSTLVIAGLLALLLVGLLSAH